MAKQIHLPIRIPKHERDKTLAEQVLGIMAPELRRAERDGLVLAIALCDEIISIKNPCHQDWKHCAHDGCVAHRDAVRAAERFRRRAAAALRNMEDGQ